jgi:flagellar protein FliS
MRRSQREAAAYRAVRSHGLVEEASPARLVQIVYDQILMDLATAKGCMARISGNLPLDEVRNKCTSVARALRLIGHLDTTLDLEKGGAVADNLRNLYVYMMNRLTQANVTNDAAIVAEVAKLVVTIKKGWDKLVKDGH